MPDTPLISEIDDFLRKLLAEAANDKTASSEDGPGPVSFAARVSLLSAMTQYLRVRNGVSARQQPDDADGDEIKTADREPEIVEFERRLNRKRGARSR